jgi:hypothetical protein
MSVDDPVDPYLKYVDLAHEALSDFEIPPRCGAVLMGSLAERLGNDRSDIDLMVIDPEPNEYPTFVQLTWAQDQRAEVLFRSAQGLADFSGRMNRLAHEISQGARPIANHDMYVDAEEYHKYQNGIVLRGDEIVSSALTGFSRDALKVIKSYYETAMAQQARARAIALLALGLADESLAAAQVGLTHALAAWAASRGETYPSNKFLRAKLERAGMSQADLATLLMHLRATAADSKGEEASACLAAGAAFVSGLSLSAEPRVRVRPGTVLHELFDDLLIPYGAGTLVIDRSRREAVRRIVSEGAATGEGTQIGSDAEVIAELLRLDLVELLLGEGCEPIRCEGVNPAPAREFTVTWSGVEIDVTSADAEVLHFVPASLGAIASCGVSVLHHGFGYAALKEDAIGGVRAGQWPLVEDALRRMFVATAMGRLASRAISPLPSREFLSIALERAGVDVSFIEGLRTIAGRSVDDVDSAKGLIEVVARHCDAAVNYIFGEVAASNESYAAGEAMRRATVHWWLFAHRLELALPFHADWSRELQEIFESDDPMATAREQMFKMNNNSRSHEAWNRADSLELALAE